MHLPLVGILRFHSDRSQSSCWNYVGLLCFQLLINLMWKGGVLSEYNHNICVYNLTITSACYGQHVECVRPEVQMVLFNTVSTVHVVNRTRVNSRSIIIATLNTLDMLSCKTTRVWNGCSVVSTSLLIDFTPPKNCH